MGSYYCDQKYNNKALRGSKYNFLFNIFVKNKENVTSREFRGSPDGGK